MTTLGHRILLQVQGFWKRKLRYLGTEITDTINLDNKERVGDCTAVEKAVAPHSSTLAWKIHGRRSLVGCSPWGRWGLDTTERLHFHFSLSCTGEGNGNPLQCSCLENPKDGGAWWSVIYGVAQSRTRLKWLSSSSRTLLTPCRKINSK